MPVPAVHLRAGAAGFALYTVFALAFTYPLALHLGSGVLHGIDTPDAFQQAWVLSWVDHALRYAPGSLLNAPIFFPTENALAYMDCMLPVAILVLPIQLATNNAAIAYNVAVIMSFPFSALCMYAWAARVCRDPRAAFLAGLIYAYCPYRLRHLEHLNTLSAEFVPLTLLSFDLVRTRGGGMTWLALGGCLVGGALTSLYYFAFTVLALAAYSGALALAGQLHPPRWRTADLAVFLVPLLLLAAVLYPYVKVSATATGSRRMQDVVFFAADLRDFLHDGPQSLLYGWSDRMWRLGPLDSRQYLFPGLVALALAVAAWKTGLGAGVSRRPRGIFRPAGLPAVHLELAAFFAVLAMGPYLKLFGGLSYGPLGKIPLPYLALYDLLPPLRGLRDVGRLDQVSMAFLAAASAAGASALLQRRPDHANQILVGISALILLEFWPVQQPLVPIRSGSAVPPAYTWLRDQPPGNVLDLPICDSRLPWAMCTEEYTYMYYQTVHWHTLLNGWQGSGSYPRDWGSRTAMLESFPSSLSLELMHKLGVRYVMLHSNYPELERARRWLGDPANRATAGVRREVRLGTDIALVLDQNHA